MKLCGLPGSSRNLVVLTCSLPVQLTGVGQLCIVLELQTLTNCSLVSVQHFINSTAVAAFSVECSHNSYFAKQLMSQNCYM